jgi:hypothetical protein
MSGLLNQLSQLHPDSAAILVGVLAIASLVALLIGGVVVRRYFLKKAEIELAMSRCEAETLLKAKMLDRGFSADEIERVLAATLSMADDGSQLARI